MLIGFLNATQETSSVSDCVQKTRQKGQTQIHTKTENENTEICPIIQRVIYFSFLNQGRKNIYEKSPFICCQELGSMEPFAVWEAINVSKYHVFQFLC